jgi:hypothetical protein
MEIILNTIYSLLIPLHILNLTGLLVKILLSAGFKSLSPVYILTSYFKFYNHEDAERTNNEWRRLYVKLNNGINYYTYAWAFVCLMCLVAFKNLGF